MPVFVTGYFFGLNNMASLLEYALNYSKIGWHVFPVHSIDNGICTCRDINCTNPGKHPVSGLVRDGVKSASKNPELIKAWWEKIPNANIGVATGIKSGFWVLDIDGTDGETSLDKLVSENEKLPDTVESLTGGGGRHLLFSCDGNEIKNSANLIAKKIDIRGEGGYIIVEPSIHISGSVYQWEGSSDPLEGISIASAPGWLIKKAINKRNLKLVADKNEPINEGGRNITLTAMAGALRRQGASQNAILLALEGINNEQCSPPLPPQELALIARSVSRYDVEPGSPIHGAQIAANLAENVVHINSQRSVQIKKEEEAKTSDFPVNGLDEIADWISSHGQIIFPEASKLGALMVASLAASRMYVTELGDPCSIYSCIIGRSISELRYINKAIQRFFTIAGLRRVLRTTRFTSPASIYRTLLKSPACLYLSDDYGSMVAFARRQPSGVQEHALSVLSSIYDAAMIQLDSPEDAGLRAGSVADDQPVIFHPSLCILALVGTDSMSSLLRSSEVGRGATGQMLLTMADLKQAVLREPEPRAPAVGSIAQLHAIRGLSVGLDEQADLASVFQGNAELNPSLYQIPFVDGLIPYYERLDKLSSDPLFSPILLSSRAILRRISAVLAVWRNPQDPFIDRELLDWSADFLSNALSALARQFNVFQTEDGRQSLYDTVLSKILETRDRGISLRDLTNGCRAYRSLSSAKRGELIEQMIGDRAVFEIKIKALSGQMKKRLIGASHVLSHDPND